MIIYITFKISLNRHCLLFQINNPFDIKRQIQNLTKIKFLKNKKIKNKKTIYQLHDVHNALNKLMLYKK